MIAIEHRDNLVNVAALGEFTIADYREFERQVIDELQAHGKVNALFDLRDMLGYTIDVAWEELRFSREHARDFGRIAIVTEDRWLAWSAWLTRLFTDADVQVFDDYEAARAWASGEADLAQ